MAIYCAIDNVAIRAIVDARTEKVERNHPKTRLIYFLYLWHKYAIIITTNEFQEEISAANVSYSQPVGMTSAASVRFGIDKLGGDYK